VALDILSFVPCLDAQPEERQLTSEPRRRRS